MMNRLVALQLIIGLFAGVVILKFADLALTAEDADEYTSNNASLSTSVSLAYTAGDWDGHVWKNKYNLVHIIQTDFLRYQHGLVNLKRARFELFETFTLPSILRQTTKQFLWVIYVDPHLNAEFRKRLVSLVQGMPNVVILGYHRVHKEDFRTLHGMDLNTMGNYLMYGDARLLIDYYRASQSHVMIETRLDADDALSLKFAESIQGQAAASLGISTDPLDYRVFCAEHHVEWRYYKPDDEMNVEGHLVHYHNPEFCVNSGLTIGYQVEARERNLIHTEQCYFAFWMNNCGDRPMQVYYIKGKQHHRCLARIFMPDQADQVVLISRTPVAAGMKHVMGTGDEAPYKDTFESPKHQKQAWEMIRKEFNVQKQNVLEMRQRFENNIEAILDEALLGQCTPGHSCKESSKKKLGRLLDEARARKKN